MSNFVPPIKRRNYGRSHGYVDGNGNKMPGVTTILSKGIPKDALINWAANATADYAVNNWDELGDLAVAARLKKLQGARYEDKDKAANRGTEVHKYAELLVRGEEVRVPEELRGHVESYVRFLDDFNVTPILIETTIASYRYGWAGTLDLVADITDPKHVNGDPVRTLLDVKTNRSGIFGETALQMAGYRYADVYLDDDGNEQPMIEVERVGAIHVRADGYSLIPLVCGPDELKALRYAQMVMRWAEDSRALVGAEIAPPDRDGPIARVVYEHPNTTTIKRSNQ